MRIRVQKFSITNYRSCSSTSFEPCSDLSALIGKNASGKSSILNGMLLLKSLFGHARRHPSVERASAKSRVNAEFKIGKQSIYFRGDVYYSTSERIRDEVFGWDANWNFRELTGSDEWSKLPMGFDFDFFENAFQAKNIHRIQSAFPAFNLPRVIPKNLPVLMRQLNQFFGGISYPSPRTRSMAAL